MKKIYLVLTLLVLMIFCLYHDSWNSRFFQDDKIHFQIISRNANFLAPPANWPYYRPVAINLFYTIAKSISGMNPLGYHLILFAGFIGSIFLVFNLSKLFLNNNKRSLVAVFFYAVNVSLFGNFYWIARSYIILGSLFMFAAVYFYQKHSERNLFLTAGSLVLALGSNELAYLTPLLFLLTDWYFRRRPKVNFWLLTGLTGAIGLLRYQLVGIPKDSDYKLHFGPSDIATVKWYLFRLVNFPESIQRDHDKILYIAAGIFLLGIIYYVFRYRKWKKNARLFVFALLWFFAAAAPHFFMPDHLSSQYLMVSLFAPAMILGEIVIFDGVLAVVALAYLLLTWRGLDFLRLTHWLILKNTGPIGKF